MSVFGKWWKKREEKATIRQAQEHERFLVECVLPALRDENKRLWKRVQLLEALRSKVAERAGLTVLEVLIALGIFLLGSVSIVGLFVTASVLHADATARRTVAFIAESTLAEIKARPFRETFAKTRIVNDLGNSITVQAVEANYNSQAANFHLYPKPVQAARHSGPILIRSEWAWYQVLGLDSFDSLDRNLWGTTGGPHAPFARVLQPRSWYYVLDNDLVGPDDPNFNTTSSLTVRGEPDSLPSDATSLGAPSSAYIVIDEEWIRYTSRHNDSFDWADPSEQRGVGDSSAAAHRAGSPVTVAREHPRYPGFYYMVQFYPVNATGAESKVIVSVAHGSEAKLRRAFFFHTIYSPSRY